MNARIAALAISMAALAPASAHANDGGWLDWLYRLDAKFWGLSTEVHVLCLDNRGESVKCEDWYMIPKLFGADRAAVSREEFGRLRHEVSVRFSHYWTYGDLYEGNENDGAKAFKLMAHYAYSPAAKVHVGAGAGLFRFYGHDLREARSSFIVTPLTVVYSPFEGPISRTLYLRAEASYITSTLTSGAFTNGRPSEARGEWNGSVGVGFDFRRRGSR
jgi:hypothetical protein